MTPEQVRAAIERARQAGDQPAVESLTRLLPKVANNDQDYGALARMGAQGATLGFGDEIEAAIRAPFENRPYSAIRDDIRAQLDAYREKHPWKSLAAEAAGGMLVPGLGTAGLLGRSAKLANEGRKALSIGRQLKRAASVGAGLGAVAGAGQSRSTGDLLPGMTMGALSGAAGGLLGQGLAAGASRLFAKAPEQAGNILRGSLGESDPAKAIARYEAFQAANPEPMPGFVGPLRQAMIGSVKDIPRGQADKALEEYASRSGRRLMTQAEEVIGKPQNYVRDMERFRTDMSKQAARAYGQAFKQMPEIEVTGTMREIIGVPEARKAWSRAVQRQASRSRPAPESVKSMVKNPETVGDLQYWDRWGKEMRSQIEAAKRKSPTRAAELTRLRNDVLGEIDAQNPAYQAARKQFADNSALREAAEKGRKLFTMKPDELAMDLESMSAAEREMFQRGGLKALRDRIGSRAKTGNITSALTSRADDEARLRLLFGDEGLQKFMAKAVPESDRAELIRMSRGSIGSPTSTREGASRQLEALSNTVDLATSGGMESALRAIMRIFGAGRGISPEAQTEIANALTSGDPAMLYQLLRTQPSYSPLWGTAVGTILGEMPGASQ